MTRNVVLAGAATILLAAALSGQTPSPPQAPFPPASLRGGNGTISGQVLDDAGQPVTDAVVTLAGRGGPADRVIVDPRGRFVFRGVPAGAFAAVASRPSYIGGGMDQHDPASAPRPIELVDRQQLGNVTLRLFKAGAIEGAVLGGTNQPLGNVEVLTFRRSLVGGRWMLAPGPATTTDDAGHYRIDGLSPGDYAIAARPGADPETTLLLALLTANPIVSADIMAGLAQTSRGVPESDERAPRYALTFYSASSAPSTAAMLTIGPGVERVRTDIWLKALTSRVSVAGTISDLAAAADGVSLDLIAVDQSGARSPLASAVAACGEDGSFEFASVTPGRYIVALQTAPPPAPAPPPGPGPGAPNSPAPLDPQAWSGEATVTVAAANVRGLVVSTRRGVSVIGRVSFFGARQPGPGEVAQIAVQLDPLDRAFANGSAWRGQIDADGRLHTDRVPPGEYLLRLTAPPRGYSPMSAMSGGYDVLDAPLVVTAAPIDDVTITYAEGPAANASGIVHDAQGAPSAAASVVIFPTDRSLWRDTTPQARRLRVVRTTPSGRFGVPNLPPADYFVVAVEGELPAEWQEPGRLEQLAKDATRVHLAAGIPQPLDLLAMARPKPIAAAVTTNAASSKSKPTPSRTGATPPASAPAESAAIAGTVIDQTTKKPAANALVMIAGTDIGLVRFTSADEKGRFAFDALPSGHFLLGAGAASYLPASFGATRPGRPGATLSLETGRHLDRIEIPLTRSGVVAGRVTDEHDRPVPGARVRVLPRRDYGGEIVLNGDAGDPAVVTTDALGRYRVFNLPPGEYIVAVQTRGVIGGDVHRLTEAEVDVALRAETAIAPTPAGPQNGMAAGWAPAYAPGTLNAAEAANVVVAAGQIRGDVNVRTTLARFVRVEGTVTGSASATPPLLQVQLRPRGASLNGVVLSNLTMRPSSEGRFMFPNVPPGEYTLLARTQAPPPSDRPGGPPPPSPGVAQWASAELTVMGENVTGVALELRPALTISGRVQLEGGAPLPATLPLIRVGVRTTIGQGPPNLPDPAPIDKDGRFTIGGLIPGRYRLFVQVPNADVIQVPEWFATTAIAGTAGDDAIDVPFEVAPSGTAPIVVTLTNSTSEIDGTVRDPSGRAARECTVVVFSTDARFWFPQSRRVVLRQSDRDGRFVFGISAGLPAGDYFIVALPDGRPGEQLDPLVLKELSATATRVRLSANDSQTVEIRIR